MLPTISGFPLGKEAVELKPLRPVCVGTTTKEHRSQLPTRLREPWSAACGAGPQHPSRAADPSAGRVGTAPSLVLFRRRRTCRAQPGPSALTGAVITVLREPFSSRSPLGLSDVSLTVPSSQAA